MSAFSISDFSVSKENKLDGDHLVAACKVVFGDNLIETYALIDTGCSGFAFIDETFARQQNFPFLPLKTHRTLHVIDGRSISSGKVTHACQVQLIINSHQEISTFFITKLGSYPLVLGIPWLQLHDPLLRFKDNIILFDSKFCSSKCNNSLTPTPIKGILPSQRLKLVSTATLTKLARQHKLHVNSTTVENIESCLKDNDNDD